MLCLVLPHDFSSPDSIKSSNKFWETYSKFHISIEKVASSSRERLLKISSLFVSQKRNSVIFSANFASSSPWIIFTTSYANFFCPILFSGVILWSAKIWEISCKSKRVSSFKYLSISASSVFIKYWNIAYGVVLFLSKNNAFPSDFQNFFPLASVISGQVKQ